MADILSTSLRTTLAWDRREAKPLGEVRDKKTLAHGVSLADGTGSGQADSVFHDTRMIPANSYEILDVSALTKQMFTTSVPIGFTVIRLFRVANTSSAAGRFINVGADATTPTSYYAMRIGPGDEFVASYQSTGWLVHSGNYQVVIANPSNGPATYDIVVIGSTIGQEEEE